MPLLTKEPHKYAFTKAAITTEVITRNEHTGVNATLNKDSKVGLAKIRYAKYMHQREGAPEKTVFQNW